MIRLFICNVLPLFFILILQSCQNKELRSPAWAPIVGGEIVQPDDEIAKSTVAILMYSKGQFTNYCTGTIVSKRTILTATHCFESQPDKVMVVFSNDVFADLEMDKIKPVLDSEYIKTKPFVYLTDEYFINKKENFSLGQDKDTAILKLKKDIPAGQKPADILEYKDAQSILLDPDVFDTLQFQIAGYGYTNSKKELSEKGMKLRKRTVKFLGLSGNEFPVTLKVSEGMCFGDSGGPLMVNLRGKNYVFGSASYTEDDPCESTVGYYHFYFRNLIDRNSVFNKPIELINFDPNSYPNTPDGNSALYTANLTYRDRLSKKIWIKTAQFKMMNLEEYKTACSQLNPNVGEYKNLIWKVPLKKHLLQIRESHKGFLHSLYLDYPGFRDPGYTSMFGNYRLASPFYITADETNTKEFYMVLDLEHRQYGWKTLPQYVFYRLASERTYLPNYLCYADYSE